MNTKDPRVLVQMRLNIKARQALLSLAKKKRETLSGVMVEAINCYLADNGRRPVAEKAVMGRPKK